MTDTERIKQIDREVLEREVLELRQVIAWVFHGDPHRAVCGDGKRIAYTGYGWIPWDSYVEHVNSMTSDGDAMQAQHLGVPECVVRGMVGDMWTVTHD